MIKIKPSLSFILFWTLTLTSLCCGAPSVALAFAQPLDKQDKAESHKVTPEQIIPEKVNLQPDFQEDKTSRYEIWSKRTRTMTMTVADQSRSSETTFITTGEVSWKVEHINDDGSAVCNMTFDWMKISLALDDKPAQASDSRQDTGDIPPLHKMLKAIAGSELKVTIGPDGIVTKVDGVEAMQNRAGENLPLPDELDFMETASDLAAIMAAKKELSLNDSWQSQAAWNHSLYLGKAEAKLHHDITFSVASIENIAGIPIATINGESKLRLDVDANTLPKEGPQVDIKMKNGSATTQIMFDLSRGEAVGRNSTQRTLIDATLTLQGRSITQTVEDNSQSQALRIAEE